jgi:hypothetical protein
MSGLSRRRRLAFRSAAGFVVALAVTADAADACPVCDSQTGQEVRAAVFNEDFWSNLFVSLAPFPIFLGIVAAIHGRPTRRGTAPSAVPAPAANADGFVEVRTG